MSSTTRGFRARLGAPGSPWRARWGSRRSRRTSSGTITSARRAATISRAIATSRISSASREKRASTSSCGPDRTSAPSGSSGVFRGGCSRAARFRSERRTSASWHRCVSGCVDSEKSSLRSSALRGVRSWPCSLRTSTVRSERTRRISKRCAPRSTRRVSDDRRTSRSTSRSISSAARSTSAGGPHVRSR